ncbi:hypothetical protein amad1_19940 [Alteromonas mediterranea DE1]|nr:hypothetical protein amad1_19940 [Alteromonas mediterranea DE1]AGP95460.1 hypothetical protein I634_18920 [Alteromonas mediterranea U8]
MLSETTNDRIGKVVRKPTIFAFLFIDFRARSK